MKRIRWTERAKRDVRAIDRATVMRIFAAIDRYARTGVGDIKQLQLNEERRLRVGEWRVFFVQQEPTDMTITRVANRKQAYSR